jgi:hypothetical protein
MRTRAVVVVAAVAAACLLAVAAPARPALGAAVDTLTEEQATRRILTLLHLTAVERLQTARMVLERAHKPEVIDHAVRVVMTYEDLDHQALEAAHQRTLELDTPWGPGLEDESRLELKLEDQMAKLDREHLASAPDAVLEKLFAAAGPSSEQALLDKVRLLRSSIEEPTMVRFLDETEGTLRGLRDDAERLVMLLAWRGREGGQR